MVVVSFGTLSSARPLVAAVSLCVFLALTARQLLDIRVAPSPALQHALGEVADADDGAGGSTPTGAAATATVTSVHYVPAPAVDVPAPPPINVSLGEDGFPRGYSGFQPDGLSKHLVMPKMETDNIGWIHKLPGWLNLTTKVYVPDEADGRDEREHDVLTVPTNKGNEAMVYFTYIINHYHNLPDVVVFTHAHASAWHNNDLHYSLTPLMLRELNYARVLRRGYVSLRSHWHPGCPSWIHPNETSFNAEKAEESVFGEAFLQLFGYQSLIPLEFGGPCCAQFAVSRARILENSVGEYRRWRQWLVDTRLPDSMSGRVMEYMWQYVFSPRDARRPVDCPPEHAAYCDGYGLCFGGPEPYRAHLALRREMDTVRHRLRLAEAQGLQPGEDPAVRDAGMQEWRERAAAMRERVEDEVWEARLNGLDADARRREVGDDEFSG